MFNIRCGHVPMPTRSSACINANTLEQVHQLHHYIYIYISTYYIYVYVNLISLSLSLYIYIHIFMCV